MMPTRIPASLLLLVLACFAPSRARADDAPHERESCEVCGMWVDEYQHSATTVVYTDGRAQHTCGVACMLRVVDAQGRSAFQSITVRDWISRAEVDAERAYYSIGSDLIPDMLPNYIAFANREDAEAFSKTRGGAVVDFEHALEINSPRGATQPFRIRQAVTPGKGTFGLGLAYAYMVRDRIMVGTDRHNPFAFIDANPAQPRAPSRIENNMQALVVNYSATDDTSLLLTLPYFEKSMKTYERNGGTIGQTTSSDNGFGDLAIEARYNGWRSTYFDKFLTVLGGITLPSGSFDSTRAPSMALGGRQVITTAPGMQLGTGAPSFTTGLLYSQRFHRIWLHGQGLYRPYVENSDDYKLGDEAQIGAALHYTPHYDYMVGIETDLLHALKNKDGGLEIGNTGGTRVNLAFVFDWRFVNAFGGNFTLRGSVGLPVYEDLNSQRFTNPKGQEFRQVQLGGGFFANVVVNYNRRFNPLE